MSDHQAFLDPAVAAYAAEHSTPPDPAQQRLIETTAALGAHAQMQIGRLQGTFMSLLVRALRPRLAVEVGTFTGYSALAIARELPPDGRLVCCDSSQEWTDIARTAWTDAGVGDRVELRLGPAIEALRAMPTDPEIDLAFIDADKTGYAGYFHELVPRLSRAGILLVDNVLWGGSVADPDDRSESTEAIRAFNQLVLDDDRVDVALLPVGDGMSVITLRG